MMYRGLKVTRAVPEKHIITFIWPRAVPYNRGAENRPFVLLYRGLL